MRFRKLHFIKNWYWRLRYGAGCCDTYTLYYYLAPIISRNLKAFKRRKASHPMGFSVEEWDEILDKMIFAFEYLAKNDETDEGDKRANEGLNLFGKYYRSLWY